MFGTSGIRGVVGQDVACGLFQRVSMAFARPKSPLLVATDTRPSGQMLKAALVSGALAAGADSIDMGLAPTPALAYATWKSGLRGAMITASHNPPEYNGLKLFENGLEIPKALEAEIEKKAQAPLPSCAWSEAGHILPSPDYLLQYLQFLLSSVDTAPIAKAKPRVVVDCGNGAGSVATPYLLAKAGAHVLGLDCGLGGHFNRPLEPSEKNLSQACRLVCAAGADFGIAHDGDADRAVLIDERGRLVPQDVALALMIQYGVQKEKRQKPIATTVEASLIVREAIAKKGATPLITSVGSMHIAHEVKKGGLLFGGEPCGEYVFGNLVPAADGVAAALQFTRIISQSGQKLSSLCSKFRQFPIVREKFACKNKGQAMERLKKALKLSGRRSEQDGLRFDFADGWALIRPSGTEPVMRLTCEAKTQKRLDAVAGEAREAIIAACR